MNATYQAQHAEWMDDESPWIGTSHADFEIQTIEALLGTFAIPLGYFLLWDCGRLVTYLGSANRRNTK